MRARTLISTAFALLAAAAPVLAMEVTPPISFEPVADGAGYTLVVHEGPLSIDEGLREIFRDGKLIAREDLRLPASIVGTPIKLDPALEREGGLAVAKIALEAETLGKLADGYYAQKLRIHARREGDGGGKLVVHQWTYAQVSRGTIRFITNEEYSKAVDPVERAIGSLGQPTEVFVGRAVDVAVPPLDETKASEAVPVDSDDAKLELEYLLKQPAERDER
jgi:hypothetical protein